MTTKDKLLDKVNDINVIYSRSFIIKGLTDGVLSLVPVLGTAITSALDTRAFQLFERNSKQFSEEVRQLINKLEIEKIDKKFLDSDEFVYLLIEILSRNARTYEQEKVKLYARLFVNATTLSKSTTPYKEGFVRIIDELSVAHILALAFIYDRSSAFTKEDKENNRGHVLASEVAEELLITEPRALAYCDQMIRFGLLRDWSLGKYGYKPGSYAITDYGFELAEFLKSEM